MMLTVADLRKIIEGIPDDVPVSLCWEEVFTTEAGTGLTEYKSDKAMSAHLMSDARTSVPLRIVLSTDGYCDSSRREKQERIFPKD